MPHLFHDDEHTSLTILSEFLRFLPTFDCNSNLSIKNQALPILNTDPH
jgi:hypothetical protein